MDNIENNVTENCCLELDEKKHVERSEKINNALIKRLNRIEGQVRGVKGMIEKGVYCDDVLIQIAAVQSAMKGVSRLLFESHIHTCIIDRIKSDDEEVVDEFLKTIDRMIK